LTQYLCVYTLVRHSKTNCGLISHGLPLVTELKIPLDVIKKWNLKDGDYTITDQLYNNSKIQLEVVNGAESAIKLAPSESFIYQL
jgi:hypothetical protein